MWKRGCILKTNIAALAAVLWLPCSSAFAQIDEECTVSVNGQTVNVNADGSFVISNVPAGTNLVRVTAICNRDGVTLYGVSEFFEVVNGQTLTIEDIPLLPFPPKSMVSLSASSPVKILDEVGQTVQLDVSGIFSDGTMDDVHLRTDGSTYVTTNPNVISVDSAGLVTAIDLGVAFVTVTNQGSTSTTGMTVSLAPPTSVEGFVLLDDGTPVEGATVRIPSQALEVASSSDGRFVFPTVASDLGPILVTATALVGKELVAGASGELPAVEGGLTDAGLIVLGPAVETFFYDTRSTSTSGSVVLEAGVSYVVEVDGTYSFWTASQWGSVCLGVPEPSPRYRSPGAGNGQVGVDPEFIFAVPGGASICGSGLTPPIPYAGFQFNLGDGSGWFSPVPLNPGFDREHFYIYQVTGANSPLHVRIIDSFYGDNYGQLRVIIH